MAQGDFVNRSIDAGRDVTQRTQERIEALLREVAKVTEEQTSQAQQLVQELVERSRATTEQFVEVVDRELRSQLNAVGLATRTDIERLERKIEELRAERAPARKSPAKKAAAKKSPAAKAAAKKSPAAKAVAK